MSKLAHQTKKKRRGIGCCKSSSVQRKQVVAQRMLKQVHMRKDLLAAITTKITPMVKVVWGRNKNKRKEEKKNSTLQPAEKRSAGGPQMSALPWTLSSLASGSFIIFFSCGQ